MMTGYTVCTVRVSMVLSHRHSVHTTVMCWCARLHQRGVLPTDVLGVQVCDGGGEEPCDSVAEPPGDEDGGAARGAEGVKGKL